LIILDTNVVSEPLRLKPSASVLAWLDRQAPESLFLTAVNVAELLDGVGRLPAGRKRQALAAALQDSVLTLFVGRILPFDGAAAAAFARLHERARLAGQTLGVADAYIAAIAQIHGYAVASRDRAPFLAAGVECIDPWSA
jgi:toxin FitB